MTEDTINRQIDQTKIYDNATVSAKKFNEFAEMVKVAFNELNRKIVDQGDEIKHLRKINENLSEMILSAAKVQSVSSDIDVDDPEQVRYPCPYCGYQMKQPYPSCVKKECKRKLAKERNHGSDKATE